MLTDRQQKQLALAQGGAVATAPAVKRRRSTGGQKPEAQVKAALKAALAVIGCRVLPFVATGYTEAGVSDFVGITPDGRFIAIEVKCDAPLTVQQWDFLANIAERDGIAFVFRSSVEDRVKHADIAARHLQRMEDFVFRRAMLLNGQVCNHLEDAVPRPKPPKLDVTKF